MGKKLIIPGADFSANGFRVANFVDVTLKEGGTNPYKMYFLTNPVEMYYSPNTLPTLPTGSVEKSISADAEELINSPYVGFLFARNSQSQGDVIIGSLKVDFDRVPVQCIGMCFGLQADLVDLRGISFADDINSSFLFTGASIKELKMPNINISTGRWMFYNLNNAITELHPHSDFTFIRKISGDLTGMFQNMKSYSANFSGIDVLEAKIFNDTFHGCENLEEIDLSTWHINSATYSMDMFNGCTKVKTIHLDNFASDVPSTRATDMFTSTPALTKVFVTSCSSTVKTWLLARLNECAAGGSTNWSETTVDGKACLTHS